MVKNVYQLLPKCLSFMYVLQAHD